MQSVGLLQSIVDEINNNNKEVKQSRLDIQKINEEIIDLKAFDVNEEAVEALQDVLDIEAAAVIVDLQEEILALKASDGLQDVLDIEAAAVIVDLQEEVKDLKSNEEKEKFDEIANLELMITRLKEELVALNGGEPILNDGEKPIVGGVDAAMLC
tara:strand:- start:1065 stop:1529 length:465 start_codon:yes stop_codon:yes gene_type:complete